MIRLRPARAQSLLALATITALACASPAQPANPPARLADIQFPATPSPGPVSIRAQVAHRWADGGVQRLALLGDVRLTLGGRALRARRGVLWLRHAGDRIEVFAYLEGVGDPAAPAGGDGLDADVLRVKGAFEVGDGATLTTDLVREGAPGELEGGARGLLERADAALARSAGLSPPEPDLPPLPRYTPSGRTASRPSPLRAPAVWQPAPAPTAVVQAPAPPAPSGPAAPPAPPLAPRPDRAAAVPPPPTGPTPTPGPERGAEAPTPVPPRASPQAPGSTPTAAQPPIFAKEGTVTVAPRNFSVVAGEEESAVTAWGGVWVQYADAASGRTLQLSAQRAVVFLDPGPVGDLAAFRADRVRGIYLEGNVTATDGRYHLRGPQVYYDLRANRAVMLDAVFWTFDEQRQLPIYVRAKTIRQVSAESFLGESAEFTNSAFFDPELSIGASSITITRRPRPSSGPGDEPRPGDTVLWVDARDITGRVMGVPMTYWPRYAGDPQERIIRDIRMENRSGSGAALLTTLNAYALLGLEKPRNFSADLLADFYFERGPGLGVRASWADERQSGAALAYTVPLDRGVDVLKSGARADHDTEFRGILTLEQRFRFDEDWTLIGELALLSDETFIDGFFEDLGETRREFTNRLAANRRRGHTSFHLELSGTLNDFISNEYLLESQGYSVTRLPEATYARYADDLLADTHPGLLTWSSEYRVGRLELAFDEVTAREHGLTTTTLSQRGLGILPDESLGDSLRSRGYTEAAVIRADTRHELAAQFNAGPIRVNPFVVGRATFWDDTFDAFSPDEDDDARLWGAAGLRLSTTLQRVYDSVDSEWLDLHRLRHVIEPSATFWTAGTTIDAADLPVYNQGVEALPDGAMMRLGVTQTIQTQRGGPGRWHNTNLLTLSTDFVFSSSTTPARGPIGRFFDFRPENSNPGDWFVGDAALRLTDATSLTGSVVYDLDEGEPAASSIGLLFRQYPEFTASVDVRYLNPGESTYLTFGLGYELTSKYSVGFGAAFDTDEGQFQYTAVEVRRRFQSSILAVVVTTNEISGQTGIGLVIRPYGAGGEFGVSALGARVGAR
jgi:hypothetical protein